MKRTPLPRRKKPIRRVSKRRSAQLRRYTNRRRAFLREHPICDACKRIPNANWDMRLIHRSNQIHHIRGRLNHWLLDENYWLAVCQRAQNWIHANGREARELGLLK